MRSVRHPGPPSAERIFSAPCQAERLTLTLEPGRSVNRAVAEAFDRAGFAGGYIRLRDAAASPMRYVIPAAAVDGRHAAWYSETFAPEGVTVIEDAGMVVGRRDGEPFLHCHGLWRTPDGARRMGHLLPLEAEFAEPVEAEAWAVSGAAFHVRDDEETNFRLFRPVPQDDGTPVTWNAIICAIKPNQDIGAAVEEACRRHGIANASVHGIGSLVGADFEEAERVHSYATEVLIGSGEVRDGQCGLDIALVGLDGAIGQGRLVRGTNPVCVTFEVLIIAR